MDQFQKASLTFPLSGGLRTDVSPSLTPAGNFQSLTNFVFKKQGEITTRKHIERVIDLDNGYGVEYLGQFKNELLYITDVFLRSFDERNKKFLHRSSEFTHGRTNFIPVAQKEKDILYPSLEVIGQDLYYFYLFENQIFYRIFDVNNFLLKQGEVQFGRNAQFDRDNPINMFASLNINREIFLIIVTKNVVNIVSFFPNALQYRDTVELEDDVVGIRSEGRSFHLKLANRSRVVITVPEDNLGVSVDTQVSQDNLDIPPFEGDFTLEGLPDGSIQRKEFWGFREWMRFGHYNIVWSAYQGIFIIHRRRIIAKINAGLVPYNIRDLTTFSNPAYYDGHWFFPVFISGQVEIGDEGAFRPIGVGISSIDVFPQRDISNLVTAKAFSEHMIMSCSYPRIYDGNQLVELGFNKLPVLSSFNITSKRVSSLNYEINPTDRELFSESLYNSEKKTGYYTRGTFTIEGGTSEDGNTNGINSSIGSFISGSRPENATLSSEKVSDWINKGNSPIDAIGGLPITTSQIKNNLNLTNSTSLTSIATGEKNPSRIYELGNDFIFIAGKNFITKRGALKNLDSLNLSNIMRETILFLDGNFAVRRLNLSIPSTLGIELNDENLIDDFNMSARIDISYRNSGGNIVPNSERVPYNGEQISVTTGEFRTEGSTTISFKVNTLHPDFQSFNTLGINQDVFKIPTDASENKEVFLYYGTDGRTKGTGTGSFVIGEADDEGYAEVTFTIQSDSNFLKTSAIGENYDRERAFYASLFSGSVNDIDISAYAPLNIKVLDRTFFEYDKFTTGANLGYGRTIKPRVLIEEFSEITNTDVNLEQYITEASALFNPSIYTEPKEGEAVSDTTSFDVEVVERDKYYELVGTDLKDLVITDGKPRRMTLLKNNIILNTRTSNIFIPAGVRNESRRVNEITGIVGTSTLNSISEGGTRVQDAYVFGDFLYILVDFDNDDRYRDEHSSRPINAKIMESGEVVVVNLRTGMKDTAKSFVLMHQDALTSTDDDGRRHYGPHDRPYGIFVDNTLIYVMNRYDGKEVDREDGEIQSDSEDDGLAINTYRKSDNGFARGFVENGLDTKSFDGISVFGDFAYVQGSRDFNDMIQAVRISSGGSGLRNTRIPNDQIVFINSSHIFVQRRMTPDTIMQAHHLSTGARDSARDINIGSGGFGRYFNVFGEDIIGASVEKNENFLTVSGVDYYALNGRTEQVDTIEEEVSDVDEYEINSIEYDKTTGVVRVTIDNRTNNNIVPGDLVVDGVKYHAHSVGIGHADFLIPEKDDGFLLGTREISITPRTTYLNSRFLEGFANIDAGLKVFSRSFLYAIDESFDQDSPKITVDNRNAISTGEVARTSSYFMLSVQSNTPILDNFILNNTFGLKKDDNEFYFSLLASQRLTENEFILYGDPLSVNRVFIEDEVDNLEMTFLYTRNNVYPRLNRGVVSTGSGVIFPLLSLRQEITKNLYGYRYLYKWIDSKGFEHRSRASTPHVVESGSPIGGLDSVSFFIENINVSEKQGIVAEIYRTRVNATTYRKLKDVNLNDTDKLIQITDNTPDEELIGQSIEPYLVNFQPEAHSIIEEFSDRFFMAGFLNFPNRIFFSNINPLSSNIAPSFSSDNTFYMDSKVLGMKEMDERLIIFCEENIFYWEEGAAQPQNITGSENIGLESSSSIGTTKNGIIFQSKRGIYLLTRGLSFMYIGDPVQDYENETIIKVVENTKENEVRLITNNGNILVYNHHFKKWSVFDVDAKDTFIYKDEQYYLIGNSNQIFKDVDKSDNTIKHSLDTGGIILGKALQDYKKIKGFLLSGDMIDVKCVSAEIFYDNSNISGQTIEFDLDKLKNDYNRKAFSTVDLTRQRPLRFLLRRQKCHTIRIVFTILASKVTLDTIGVEYIRTGTPTRVPPKQIGG